MRVKVVLLFSAMMGLVGGDSPSAKFTLGTVYDTETRWGPSPGEEYLSIMQIFCARHLDPMPLSSPWRSTVSPKIIHIINCTLPAAPLVEVFSHLNFDITHTDKLKLTDASFANELPENYSAGFPINKLELTNVSKMSKGFFASLKKLNKMTVENMEMPPLDPTPPKAFYEPGTGRILVLYLRNTTVKNMVNCEFIESLHAAYMKEDQITEWPEGCGARVRSLKLESMSSAAVDKMAAIRPGLNIENLSINNCSLTELPTRLMRGVGGERRFFQLRLPNNHLEDTALLKFPVFLDMNYLDLSNNRLTGECLRTVIPKIGGGMSNLQEFILDGNNLNTSLFEDHELKSLFAKQPTLQRLSLNRMRLRPDCFKHTRFNWLSHFGLASNKSGSELIENLQLHDLPGTGASAITVDLRGHGVRSVRIGPNFTERFENMTLSDHWLTNKGYKLVVLLDFIDCECNNDVIQRALQLFPEHLSMPSLRCNSKNGSIFLEEPMENLSCRKATVNGCKRKLSRDQNYTTLVDCSNIGHKFLWPKPKGLRGLNVSRNGISSLHNAYLPDSLEWLDLRNNNLSSLSTEDGSILFGPSKRRLWLAGNPFICNCENRLTLEALQEHKTQILDYRQVSCRSQGPVTLLTTISIFELCKSGYSDIDLYDFGLPNKNREKKIFCSGPLEQEKILPTKESFDILSLEKCIMSMKRLDLVLESLNIDIRSLQTLRLNQVIMPPNLERHYSAGLGVHNVELSNIQNFPFNFFSHLGSLRRLTAEDMSLPGLPPSNNVPLFEMTLKNSTVRNWNCVHLQTLKLISVDKSLFKSSWPEDCGGLRYLSLENMTQEAVERVIVNTNGTSLRELLINHCSLVDLPLSLMQHLDRLATLNFSHNELEDRAFLLFPNLPNLETLDLTHNKLKGEFLNEVIPKIPKLRKLDLDGNNFVHVFRNFEIKLAITTLKFLERLSLNDMELDSDCLMYSRFPELKHLGLRAHQHGKLLKLHGLPRTGAAELAVDLTGRSFTSVEIDREFQEDFDDQTIADFWITNKGYNLVVILDYVDCVCNNDVLSRTLRDFSGFLSMPGLRCDSKEGAPFTDEPLASLNCLKATVHGCKRRISRDYDYVTIVDCSYISEKFRWPRPDKKYLKLNASGNGITSLRNAYLPETLQFLDLRSNKISRLDGNQTALLFNSSRRMWLSGNPIDCQCENYIFLNALRANHSQITDYDEITCADSGQFLRLVSVDELCRFQVEFVWWTLIALAILALSTALLLRHFWIPLRMYLFVRGYCLNWLDEEDVDEDRPFDAFLSFAHGDNQYVLEQLLPQLEGEPNFYRICVHYRDWAVGEWIPAQIMHSVRLSKRTIIVLSKNFAGSLWGSMEFRCTLASMESEGRSRLLMLVLDDVLSENLTPELRNYLNSNTYLRCDDPWFWEKLRFVMPRVKRKPATDGQSSQTENVPPSEILRMNSINSRNSNHSAPEISVNGDENSIPCLLRTM